MARITAFSYCHCCISRLGLIFHCHVHDIAKFHSFSAPLDRRFVDMQVGKILQACTDADEKSVMPYDLL